MDLHPSGFIETAGGCDLRYVRSQPSREKEGVLLNTCEAKYSTEFQLPYRNISRYVSELQQSWDKLNTKDKKVIVDNLIHNVPELRNTFVQSEQSQGSGDVKSQTRNTLDELYRSDQKSVDLWTADQSILFHVNMKTVIVTILLMIVAFLIGSKRIELN